MMFHPINQKSDILEDIDVLLDEWEARVKRIEGECNSTRIVVGETIVKLYNELQAVLDQYRPNAAQQEHEQ